VHEATTALGPASVTYIWGSNYRPGDRCLDVAAEGSTVLAAAQALKRTNNRTIYVLPPTEYFNNDISTNGSV
jgi:hypothetical protein